MAGHFETSSLSTYNDSSLITLPEFNFETEILKTCHGDVSDEVHDKIEYIVDLWISSFICYVGVIGNIIAIIVFAKMGFQNTINISLTSIVFWDFIKCLCNIIIRVYGPISLVSRVQAHNWKMITNIICGYLYTFSGYISGVVASYVALERCLSVSLPFTVKFLLTRKVVIFVNIAAPVLVMIFHGAVFTIVGYTYKYSPKYNTSVADLLFKPLFYSNPSIDEYTSLMSMLSPMMSFAIMSICTIIISIFLRRASKTRSSIMNTYKDPDKSDQMSSRDKQIIKTLLAVISVYIATYIPKIVFYIATFLVPEFRLVRCLRNYTWIGLYVMYISDFINAVVNPFIFYFMSSSFKKAFLELFRIGAK